MPKMKSLSVSLFSVSLYLFIFLALNREFSLFHIDLRYAMVAVSVIALLFSVHDAVKYGCPAVMGAHKLLLAYYAMMLPSFLVLMNSSLPIDAAAVANVAVLHISNLLMLVLIILNRKALRFDKCCVVLGISGIVLAASQMVVYAGGDISTFLQTSDVSVMYQLGEHWNLFGQHFRISGFAEDPNYACFFNVLTIASVLYIRKRHKALCFFGCVAALLGITVAWSRTVVLTSILVGIAVSLAYALPRIKRAILCALPLGTAAMSLLLPVIGLSSLQTMGTRYLLWSRAYRLFLKSPIIGNGLTSFRSFNTLQSNGWYVHPHSSYWETLAEFGVIAFIVLVAVMYFAIRETDKPLLSFLIGLFAFFSVNFDCTYLAISIVIVGIIPVLSSIQVVDTYENSNVGVGRREPPSSRFAMFAAREKPFAM